MKALEEGPQILNKVQQGLQILNKTKQIFHGTKKIVDDLGKVSGRKRKEPQIEKQRKTRRLVI